MSPRQYRDKHRLLKKRLLARALELWPAKSVHGPERQVPMMATIEEIIWVVMTGCAFGARRRRLRRAKLAASGIL